MTEKLLTVYLKTQPASMGYLCKMDIKCSFCDFYSDKTHPKCFEDKNCVVHEYIKDKTNNTSTEVKFNTTEPNNPKVNVIAKDINGLHQAHTIAKRAIEIALGDTVNQKQK